MIWGREASCVQNFYVMRENVEFSKFLACLSTETIKKMSGMVVDIIYSVYLLSPASVASRATPHASALGGRPRQIVVNSAHQTPCCSRIAAAAPLSFMAQGRTAARPARRPGRIDKKGMP